MSFPFWPHGGDSSFYFSNSVDPRGEEVSVKGTEEVGLWRTESSISKGRTVKV